MKAVDLFKVFWTFCWLVIGLSSVLVAVVADHYCPIFYVEKGCHPCLVILPIGWMGISIWAATIPWWDWK